MKKGITQYSLPQVSISTFLRKAREAGFDGAELVLREDGDLTLHTTENELQEIVKTAQQEGIAVCDVAAGILGRYQLTSNDETVRRKGESVLERALEIARILQAQAVLAVPGAVTGEVHYVDAWDRSRDILARAGEKYRAAKVNLALENGGMKFLASPLEFRDFVDSFENDYIGVYFDTGNAMIEGFSHQWIQILGHRIKMVHVKDFKTSVRVWPAAYTQIFEGNVDWAKLMTALREIDYAGFLVAEIPPYRVFPEMVPTDTLSRLNLLIQEVGSGR